MEEQNTSQTQLVKPVETTKSTSAKITGLILVVILLILASGYLVFQNMKLQKEIDGMKVASLTPVATADPTAGWKTYNYSNYNYSFKIPSSYIVSVGTPPPNETWILQELDLNETNASGGASDLILSVQSQILAAVLETIGTLNNFTQSETVMINGRQWTVATHTTGSVKESQYIAQVGNMSYTIDGENTKFIEQVISTMQFITSSSPVGSGTKSYNSNGVSFSYPANYTFVTSPGNAVNLLTNQIAEVTSTLATDTATPGQWTIDNSFSVSSNTDIANCLNYSGNGTTTSLGQKQIGGMIFSGWHSGGAAAGNSYSVIDYRAVKGNNCYQISLQFHTSTGAYAAPSDVLNNSKTTSDTELTQILSAFQFTN